MAPRKPSGIRDDKGVEQALARIVAMVNASEQSTHKVREKLFRAGFSDAVTEDAIGRALEYGYIDDSRYCNILIRSRINSGKGLRGIDREAEALGVSLESLEAWQEYIESDEEDELERACALLNRRPPRSKNLRDGAFRKLVSQGYSVSVASEAAQRWVEAHTS